MKLFILMCLFIISILIINVQLTFAIESPIRLPLTEGSKSFDHEISELNRNGINLFNKHSFIEARKSFNKAMILAKQFRDPSYGIVSFNLGLTLHKLNIHEEAVKHFANAKRYARGNTKILNSKIALNHECGFNPNILCKDKLPANMNIEGSN